VERLSLNSVFAQRGNERMAPSFCACWQTLFLSTASPQLALAGADAAYCSRSVTFAGRRNSRTRFRDWYFFTHDGLHLVLPDQMLRFQPP
jgi:hypothetical protein